jgi:Flp pilus assembly protein TadD
MRFAPLVLLLLADVAFGQAPEPKDTPKDPAAKTPADKQTRWKSRFVMSKTGVALLKQTTTLEDGTAAFKSFVATDYSYLVREEQGDIILLRTHQGLEGWIEKGAMLLDTDAVAYFTKAIEDDPTSAIEFYRLRGIANCINRKHDEAIADASEAIRLDPTNWARYSLRSHFWYTKKNYDKAIEDLDEALRLKPGLAGLMSSRALFRGKKADFEGAVKGFEEVLSGNGNHLSTLNNLAWLLAVCPDEKIRDGRRAVTLAEKAVELTERKNATFLDTLAAAYAEARRFDDAVRVQQEALADRRLVLDDGNAANQRLELYRQRKAYREK